MERHEEADEFTRQCLEYRDKGWETYSYYVHGYLLPLLEKLRKEGKLKKGVKQITDPSGEVYDYVGEIDDNANACGFGTATNIPILAHHWFPGS